MVVNAHPLIRTLSCDTLGRLCRVVSTTAFVNTLIQNLVDQVVKNRDPDTRSGASLALGCIHSYVGGMAAGSHLKTIVGILHSLASDPHPLVHTWALHSLWLTIDSAGLNYFPYVNSTLTVIVKLHMADSHEPTAPLANAPGGDSNADIYPSLGRILYSLLGVLGPELQFNAKTRDLCFSLFEELKNDGEPFVMVEALKCIQHFILFAPKYMDINTLVPFLQMQLTGGHHHPYLKRKAAITCFYQLVQRDPTTVRNAAVNNQLEEQLFALLDTEMDHFVQDEIKDILIRLLKDTAPESPSRWLELCKGILSKAGVTGIVVADSVQALAQHNLGAGGDDDDDGDGPSSAVPSSQGPAPTSKQPITLAKQASTVPGFVVILVPRWRTQVFALSCLRQVIPVIKAIEKPEHFDLKQARISKDSGKSSDLLILRLADLVRVAFNASTAHVYELCLGGLRFLQDILEVKREEVWTTYNFFTHNPSSPRLSLALGILMLIINPFLNSTRHKLVLH